MKSVGSSSGLYQKIRFLFLLYLQAIGGGVAREHFLSGPMYMFKILDDGISSQYMQNRLLIWTYVD